jgi:hypothetical protein
MQNGAMHHDRPGANLDPARARVHVHPFVQVTTMPKRDVVGEPEADASLDGGMTVDLQD